MILYPLIESKFVAIGSRNFYEKVIIAMRQLIVITNDFSTPCTSEVLQEWVHSLQFIRSRNEFAERLKSESIDGEMFLQLSPDELFTLQLDPKCIELFSIMLDGVHGKYGQAIDVSKMEIDNQNKSVRTGDSHIAAELNADKNGFCYGQFIVLGYDEYRLNHQEIQAIGRSNSKFKLFRRPHPNGIQFKNAIVCSDGESFANHERSRPSKLNECRSLKRDHETLFHDDTSKLISISNLNSVLEPNIELQPRVSSIVIQYAADDTSDIYQIGSAQGSNDFVVRGLVQAKSSMLSSSIGKHVCRIECSRKSPYRCFVYAGGFDNLNNMNLSASPSKKHCTRYASDDSIENEASCLSPVKRQPDLHYHNLQPVVAHVISSEQEIMRILPIASLRSLESNVKLYRPDIDNWLDVPVIGDRNVQYEQDFVSNELVSGSIIDLGGVNILFLQPSSLARNFQKSPEEVIKSLNDQRPQCPVLMQPIEFEHTSNQNQYSKALQRRTGIARPVISIIDPTECTGLDKTRHPWVFPSCGHVHGFSKGLLGRPCPLCRTQSAFSPISFAFESLICNGTPTHVFNPCGHVASLEICQKWALIPLSKPVASGGLFCRPLCPFCGKDLAKPPFSKLIMQTGNTEYVDDESLVDKVRMQETIWDEEQSDVDLLTPSASPSPATSLKFGRSVKNATSMEHDTNIYMSPISKPPTEFNQQERSSDVNIDIHFVPEVFLKPQTETPELMTIHIDSNVDFLKYSTRQQVHTTEYPCTVPPYLFSIPK